ncbi:MAG TPA: Flp family type IVb pilin [Acidimicrobiia bacterium]|nr:Flp family type IVb pilin [Acidimicrobiia bacterium]
MSQLQHLAISWQLWLNRDERGASMVEYGLLLAFIAVICVLAVKALGENVSARFSGTSASLN